MRVWPFEGVAVANSYPRLRRTVVITSPAVVPSALGARRKHASWAMAPIGTAAALVGGIGEKLHQLVEAAHRSRAELIGVLGAEVKLLIAHDDALQRVDLAADGALLG